MGLMGVSKHNFMFGAVDSADYNVLIGGDAVYDSPPRDVEQVEVPGRNGTITIDHGRFDNYELSYQAYIYVGGLHLFSEIVNRFRNALASQKGYQRLWDSFNPGQYRLAQFVNGFDAKPMMNNTVAELELKFNCKPQRFLLSGDESIDWTSSGTLENPTPFEALPNLLVYGSGQLTIEGNTITVGSSQSRIVTIDSELMECYEIVGSGLVPLNSVVSFSTGEFPVLQPGLNHITLGSGITQIKIVPHWWVI